MYRKSHLPENARPLQFGITLGQSQSFSGPSAPNRVSTPSSLRPIKDFRSDAFLEIRPDYYSVRTVVFRISDFGVLVWI